MSENLPGTDVPGGVAAATQQVAAAVAQRVALERRAARRGRGGGWGRPAEATRAGQDPEPPSHVRAPLTGFSRQERGRRAPLSGRGLSHGEEVAGREADSGWGVTRHVLGTEAGARSRAQGCAWRGGRHKRSASAAPSPAGLRVSPVAASRPPPPAATWAAPSGSARDPEGLGPGRCARGHLCQRDVTMRQCPLWRGPRGPPYFIALLSKSYRAAFSKCFAH